MLLCLLNCLLLMLCGSYSAAERGAFVGRVTERTTGEAIIGANVMAKSLSGAVITFATTDAEGRFALNVAQTEDSVQLAVAHLSYKPWGLRIKVADVGPLAIELDEADIRLNEVMVRAKRISAHGDTITYNVAGFAQQQDKSIGDVLRRMPGIDVEASGKIRYQGVDISNLYVEGGNLLGGKYGIATNGINHDDIGAVEVMENHQPLQVLRGISFAERPAINLKLKNKSKATWVVNGNAGVGWKAQPAGVVWDASAFVMTIFPKFQSITTLKSNNVGRNLGVQISDLLFTERGAELTHYISLEMPRPPSLSEARTLLNTSNLFSTNNLWKRGAADIRLQMDFYNQRIASQDATRTTYYLNAANYVVEEHRRGRTDENHFSSELNVEVNKPTYYINNRLKTELIFDRALLETTASAADIEQRATFPDYYLQNDLKLIKRFGQKHLVTFASVNEWHSKPQTLTVSHPQRQQTIEEQAFYSREQASYNFLLHKFVVTLEGGVEAYVRAINQNWLGAFNTNSTKLYVTPKIEYTLRKIELTLQTPLAATRYAATQVTNYYRLSQSSQLNVKWRPNSLCTFSLAGGCGDLPMNHHNIYAGRIMTDYRTYAQGVTDLALTTRANLTSRFSYRHGPNGLFANILLLNTWLNNPYQKVREIEDGNILYSYVHNPNRSQIFTMMGDISKTLDFMRGTASVNTSYMATASTMQSAGREMPFASRVFSVEPRLNGEIGTWANFSYGLTYQRDMLSIADMPPAVTNNFIHTFKCFLTPIDALYCGLTGEYYRNQLTSSDWKDMLMLDLNLSLNLSRRVQLQLALTNMLNATTYSYTTYSALMSTASTKYIRGRELLLTLILSK